MCVFNAKEFDRKELSQIIQSLNEPFLLEADFQSCLESKIVKKYSNIEVLSKKYSAHWMQIKDHKICPDIILKDTANDEYVIIEL
jgi:hypothetical protein